LELKKEKKGIKKSAQRTKKGAKKEKNSRRLTAGITAADR